MAVATTAAVHRALQGIQAGAVLLPGAAAYANVLGRLFSSEA
jgi:hypothetical protein